MKTILLNSPDLMRLVEPELQITAIPTGLAAATASSLLARREAAKVAVVGAPQGGFD